MLRGVWLSDQHFWQLSLKPFEVRRCHVWMAWLLYTTTFGLPYVFLKGLWKELLQLNYGHSEKGLLRITFNVFGTIRCYYLQLYFFALKGWEIRGRKCPDPWHILDEKTATPYEKVYNFLGERSMNSTNIPTHKQIVLNYDYFPPHSSFVHTYSK